MMMRSLWERGFPGLSRSSKRAWDCWRGTYYLPLVNYLVGFN